MKLIGILLACSILNTTHAFCQTISEKKDSIEGIWKGSSICQVKSSPCNDETVVYHISRGAIDNTFTIQMNKIVNNKEEEMGPLDCVYDIKARTLTAKTKDRRGRDGIWQFHVAGNEMNGTLTIEGNVLYRVITLRKN